MKRPLCCTTETAYLATITTSRVEIHILEINFILVRAGDLSMDMRDRKGREAGEVVMYRRNKSNCYM